MVKPMTLTDQYLDLINRRLPEAASSGSYPVRFNHCFARIILDNVCGCEWYRVIDKPAYKHMSQDQLKQAISLGEEFLADPQTCFTAHRTSLQYRGKLKRSVDAHFD